jgi:hypothetical protein
MERYKRAQSLGLNPPSEVLRILEGPLAKEQPHLLKNVWEGQI